MVVTKKDQPTYPEYLTCHDMHGSRPVPVRDIIWIERKARQYYVHIADEALKTNHTIQALVELLDPKDFLQVNRSVIVRISYIKNYSYYKGQQYILRLLNDVEFSMSRDRLKTLKGLLN